MTVPLTFKNHSNYEINESRIERMLSGNEQDALHMGPLDQFKDIFRTEKKADALKDLWDLIKPQENQENQDDTKIQRFSKLRGYAGEEYKKSFKIKLSENSNPPEVKLRINNTTVCRNVSLNAAMRLPPTEHIDMNMTRQETELFESLLTDYSLAEKVTCRSDRQNINVDHQLAIQELYRPHEKLDAPSCPHNGEPVHESLAFLNGGSAEAHSVFSTVGYQTNRHKQTTFTTMHPNINYLTNGFTSSNPKDDPDRVLESSNPSSYNNYKAQKEEYLKNKGTLDPILLEIYQNHNNTLKISVSGSCRNVLVEVPPPKDK
jgi:hypothetical protein